MVEKTSFMGLGGPNLVKGATGQVTDQETLGGARMHTGRSPGSRISLAKDDEHCLDLIREQSFQRFPAPAAQAVYNPPAKGADDLYGVLPADHRLPYEIRDVIDRIFDAGDAGEFLEFQPDYAPEMLCANTRLAGRPVSLIANRRGFLRGAEGPRIGGIIYTESAKKVHYFVENAERAGTPLIYLQDVSGFMVGQDVEAEGIIRAGAEMVESMSCATVPRIILTINHASGAGYYAMAGQGFDPNFSFSWPTARIGVMEGDSAVVALYSAELEKLEEDRRDDAERSGAGNRAHEVGLRAMAGCAICSRSRSCGCIDRP